MRLFARYITAALLAVALLALSFGSGVQQAEAAPATALTGVTVSSQTGTLTSGTSGSVTYTVSVTRSGTTPSNPTMAVTSGLPAGVTAGFSNLNGGSWIGGTRSYRLTITTTNGTAANTYSFNVRASSGGTNFNATGTLTVNAAVQQTGTVSFGPAPTPTYQGGNFTVSATTNSNGALTYSRISGPCALVSGATFSSSGAGACVVQADTAATAAYTAATAQQTVTIAQASQTITFPAPQSRELGAAAFQVAATASSGLPVSLSSTTPAICSVSGDMVSLLSAGLCTIAAAQSGDANYLAATTVEASFEVLAALADGCTLDGSTLTCNLWAKSGTISLPGQAQPVPVWSYTDSAAGAPGAVGPTLYAVAGQTLTINVSNQLGEPTSLQITGLGGKADAAGAAPGGRVSYTFANLPAGTYVYQAGILTGSGPRQIAMGMAGALVVREAAANTAYGQSFNEEAVLVYSEIDPAFNRSPAGFVLQKFNPAYLLVNGKFRPDATLDAIASSEGHTVLLRHVNVGMRFHALGVMGLRQTIIAEDGSTLPISSSLFAKTLGAGQTMDALVKIPASVLNGSKYAIIDTAMPAHGPAGVNGMGGMLSFISVGGTGSGTGGGTGGGTGSDTVAPTVSSINRTQNPGVTSDASVQFVVTFSESVSGVSASSFSVATTGSISGAGVTGVSGSGSSYTVTVGTGTGSGTVGLNIAAAGGIQDAAGNPLGGLPFTGETYTVDRAGPTVNLTATGNVNVGGAVALTGTISDSLSGVASASATLGGNTQSISVGANGSVSAAISTSGLPASTTPYTIVVTATDVAGNSSTQNLSFTISDSVFANGFQSGSFSTNWGWSARGTNSNTALSVNSAAGMAGTNAGLQATFTAGSYVEQVLPVTESKLNVRFYLNLHNQTSIGSGTKTIFRALGDVNGVQTEAFRLEVRRNSPNYQVRAVVARANGSSATAWQTISSNGEHYVEIAWAQGASTPFSLYVDAAAPVTLSNLLTSAYSVNTLRLGPQTSGSNNIYLDEFKATRGTRIGAN